MQVLDLDYSTAIPCSGGLSVQELSTLVCVWKGLGMVAATWTSPPFKEARERRGLTEGTHQPEFIVCLYRHECFDCQLVYPRTFHFETSWFTQGRTVHHILGVLKEVHLCLPCAFREAYATVKGQKAILKGRKFLVKTPAFQVAFHVQESAFPCEQNHRIPSQETGHGMPPAGFPSYSPVFFCLHQAKLVILLVTMSQGGGNHV